MLRATHILTPTAPITAPRTCVLLCWLSSL